MPDGIDDAGFAAFVDAQMMGPAADRALHVRFYWEPEEDKAASDKAGCPIYRDIEMCEIRVPGEKDIHRGRIKSMFPDPRLRFPEHYARFKAREHSQVVGTRLDKWGFLPPSMVKTYEAAGVVTVEQLAAMSDTAAQGIPGTVAHRQKARDFLEQAKGLAPIAEARAEIAKLRAELEALREATGTAAPPAEAPASEPKRRGRPPGSKNKPKAEPEA